MLIFIRDGFRICSLATKRNYLLGEYVQQKGARKEFLTLKRLPLKHFTCLAHYTVTEQSVLHLLNWDTDELQIVIQTESVVILKTKE